MSHFEITLEPPAEERENWVATSFFIDDDGRSRDGRGVGWGDTPAAALEMLVEMDGRAMLCDPDNPWCEYSQEALGPDPLAVTRTICLAHPHLFGQRKEVEP